MSEAQNLRIHMLKSLLCIAILVFVAISLVSATGINIDTAHHHPGDDFESSNQGISKTEPVTIEPPLKVAWTHDLSCPYPDPSWIPPISVIADGAIYLGKGGIKAIDANTGKILWNIDLDADPRGNDWDLGYNEGILYALNSPIIYALDAKTGKVLWRKEYTNIGGTPVILGNTLYAVTHDDRYVFAIDTANGNLEWKYELNLTEFGTGGRNYYSISIPAVSEDIVVFQFRASHSSYTGPPVAIEPGEPEPELGETKTKEGLIALNTKTGEEVWQYSYAGEIPLLKPFIYKDLVYIIPDYGAIIALSIESGEEVWEAEIGDWAIIAAVEEGKLFVDSNKPPLILNADTGEIFNEYPDSKLSFSSSAVTDGFIYSTSRNKIQVFDSNTGELVWTGDAIKGYDASAPTLYNDRLYLTSTDGKLYAFEHGEEPFAIKTIHIYLATLAILFMLCAIAYKTGFISKLRIKNKVLNGFIIGAVPFIIIAISLLYILIVEAYYHGMVEEGIALGLGLGFVFSLIAAVIAGILGGVLGYVSRKD